MSNDELLVTIQEMFEKKIDEIKLHTAALVEDLRSDVRMLAEGHSILDNKIDTLREDLAVTKQEAHNLNSDMDLLKRFVIGVDEKLNEHERMLKG
jgi:outer membrane murein-binding lipoprotein Lpp